MLFGEQIGGIVLPSNVIDDTFFELDDLSYRTLADVQILHSLVKDTFGPIDGTLVVAQHLSGFGHFGKIKVGHNMTKMLNGLGPFICRLDFRFSDGTGNARFLRGSPSDGSTRANETVAEHGTTFINVHFTAWNVLMTCFALGWVGGVLWTPIRIGKFFQPRRVKMFGFLGPSNEGM